MADFYYEKKTFIAKYEETKCLTFPAPPFGDRDEFNSQCIRLKRYIFQNYKGLNPDTKKVWQTKDVLLNILSQEDPAIRLQSVASQRLTPKKGNFVCTSPGNYKQ